MILFTFALIWFSFLRFFLEFPLSTITLRVKKNNAEHVQFFYKKQKGTRKITSWDFMLLSEAHLVHQV